MTFRKILIANRGEIAMRILRTCRRMGIATVAVYSEADARALHVREADEAVPIGPARAAESYLDGDRLIAVARERGCDALHPGYGFLSENAAFARRVIEAGVCFIGPPPEAIETLGDKLASKALAIRCGVPVVPGCPDPVTSLEDAIDAARGIGFPVLLKPAAGGGGRGMRVVGTEAELPAALEQSREETRKGFADDRIFVERYVVEPRHVEVQVLADRHSTVVHLGERECSIQRRHQKVIEETPSPGVDDRLREEMGRVACTLARAAGYENAGTVELILDRDRSFYFLEMNTRLQVEHPVTELVTGLDLVELQIRIAAGEPLGFGQDEVRCRGWAIEARICAEDPARGFLPTTGMITRYAVPTVENVRVDSGIEAGSVVTIHYDSLLAKVAAWGEGREQARQGLVRALNGYHIEGVTTNVDFANAIVSHPAFAEARLSTSFIGEHFTDGAGNLPPDAALLQTMAIAAVLVFHTRQNLVKESLRPMRPLVGGAPILRPFYDYVVKVAEAVHEVRVRGDRATRRWEVEIGGERHEVLTPELDFYRRRLALRIDGVSHMFRLQYFEHHIKASFCGIVRTFEIYTPTEWRLARHMLRSDRVAVDDRLRCPMPGLVTAVYVREGDEVRRGQELLRMESMKMESGVASPRDARVGRVMVAQGQTVEAGETLVVFATTA